MLKKDVYLDAREVIAGALSDVGNLLIKGARCGLCEVEA